MKGSHVCGAAQVLEFRLQTVSHTPIAVSSTAHESPGAQPSVVGSQSPPASIVPTGPQFGYFRLDAARAALAQPNGAFESGGAPPRSVPAC